MSNRRERRRLATALVADLSTGELPGYDERLVDRDAGTVAQGVCEATARVLRRCWAASPPLTSALIGLEVLAAALTAGSFLQVTDVLDALIGGGPDTGRVQAAVPALAVAAVLVMLRAAAGTGVQALLAALAPRVSRRAELAIYDAAVHTELVSYEDPDWYEALARAQDRGLSYASMSVGQLVQVLDATVGLLAVAAVLLTLHPVLLVLLVVSVAPDAWTARRSAHIGYAGMITYAMLRRRQAVMTQLVTDRPPAAEIRSYRLQRFLAGEHRRLADAVCDEGQRIELAQVRTEALGRALGGAAAALNVVVLGILVTRDAIELAAAGTALIALTTSRSLLRRLLGDLHRLYECGLGVGDMDRFVADSAARTRPATGRPVPHAPAAIEVRGVTFRYPGTALAALDGVDLTVRRGEVIGLVGENGSGKSTLSRILAGLYQPDAGSVRWDGVDLSDLHPADVHDTVALVSQDATRWPFSAATNIALGAVERDRDDGALRAAARRAGAHEMIERLPEGYETRLSRLFRGGHDLSGGQWQLLSIARGIYRRGGLLICDEPTAALDPRAEHRVYRAIQALARGDAADGADDPPAVVLISHRLSSVRHADRIYVLDAGRVVEVGTHDELLDRGGLYEELYTMQASGYREDVANAGAL